MIITYLKKLWGKLSTRKQSEQAVDSVTIDGHTIRKGTGITVDMGALLLVDADSAFARTITVSGNDVMSMHELVVCEVYRYKLLDDWIYNLYCDSPTVADSPYCMLHISVPPAPGKVEYILFAHHSDQHRSEYDAEHEDYDGNEIIINIADDGDDTPFTPLLSRCSVDMETMVSDGTDTDSKFHEISVYDHVRPDDKPLIFFFSDIDHDAEQEDNFVGMVFDKQSITIT